MNKLFTKKLALVMALMLALCSFVFVGCNKEEEKEANTTTTTVAAASEDEVATNAEGEVVTNAEGEVVTIIKTEDTAPVLAKKYKPTEAYKDGESVSLDVVFGKDYAKHGDEMVFNEDGTFTAYIGVTGKPESAKGTYKLVGNSAIELSYDNDKIETATLITFDLDNNVVEFKIIKNDYHVIFAQG